MLLAELRFEAISRIVNLLGYALPVPTRIGFYQAKRRFLQRPQLLFDHEAAAYRVDYDKINLTRMEFLAIQIAPVNAVKDRELIRKPVLE